jgi:hypothetical protein
MGTTYFKRFRMEIDLAGRDFSQVLPPPGYRFVAWDPGLLEAHAEAKFHSFRTEIDSNVFPCLAEFDGCLRLMTEIMRKDGFLSDATWLAAYEGRRPDAPEFCGTIQGVRDKSGIGAVQNLGITPMHRNRGLGTALMFKSLDGFRQAGLRRVYLEVTARNDGAIKLYRRMGFAKARTVYKAVDVVCAV